MSRGLLNQVGEEVRRRRERLGLTQKELAARAGLSLRFLAQLEHGAGNISLARFADVAAALGASPAELLAVERPRRRIALLGLRGAGKSTVGRKVAKKLGVPFVELDAEIAKAAGLSLGEIFELHGEAYYRRVERETLRRVFDEHAAAVVATGGSIVNDAETYRMLREGATCVWLRARPEDHWNRVVEQGDRRPMRENPRAFAELQELLAAREPLYAAADRVVDTSGIEVDRVAAQVAEVAAG